MEANECEALLRRILLAGKVGSAYHSRPLERIISVHSQSDD